MAILSNIMIRLATTEEKLSTSESASHSVAATSAEEVHPSGSGGRHTLPPADDQDIMQAMEEQVCVGIVDRLRGAPSTCSFPASDG